ncbi:hypothetical protein NFI96_014646 [Prochilodus magdalenae]|nr:hypothetical protein NFI96_014646 [Prochilodus magdalenae]
MAERWILLLVPLFLWEGLVGTTSVAKVVRRRGLGSVHSQLRGGNGVANQWDANLEKNGMPVVRLKELIGAEKLEDRATGHPKGGPSNGAPPEELRDFNAKPLLQVEDSSKRVRLAVDGTRDVLESRRNRNGTKTMEVLPKSGRLDKGIPIHHKIDSSLRLNRTRFKSPLRSRGRSSPGILSNAKGAMLDSPHKLNLTGSYGVLKLISKDSLVRIVNSQLQNGLNFQNKISHSRKRDLIDMDHSQAEEPDIKRQDRAVAPDVREPDNRNKTVEPHSSTVANPDGNPDQTVRTLRGPVSDAAPSSREDEKKTSTASWRSKHYTTHVASTPQSPLVELNTEGYPYPGHSTASRAPSQTDPDAKQESGLDFSTTQDPMSKASGSVDGGHILKLPPNPERGGNPGGTPTEAWAAQGHHGLVFQEMEEDEDKVWIPKEGSRSRRRRSWIWNQFFVIEEYAGPEPVLIGRSFISGTGCCPTGRCPQDTDHKTLLTGRCTQDAAHRTLPTGRCPQDAAHRTLPTGRCPQDAAHRTLPTRRCPQDTAHRTLPTGRCPQDAAHRMLPTGH